MIEAGTHAELVVLGGKYAELWQKQQDNEEDKEREDKGKEEKDKKGEEEVRELMEEKKQNKKED